MTNEHTGICIYEEGRFELRKTDNAIIDLKGDFPPIMIASNTADDGSEPNCANTRSVLHLLNELSDNNPNEERHWYLKKMLDKSWKQYHEQKDENEQLQNQIDKLEDDNEKYSKSLDKLEDYTKRFIPTKCLNEFKDCKTNRYYWLDHGGNFESALELLNLMDCENEKLKQKIKELEIENEAQSDAINGLQATLCHLDLEEMI